MEDLAMFCNQCEQTQGTGCRVEGVCGKLPEVAALQDLLTYAVRGLSHWAAAARAAGVGDPAADRFTMQALFSTLTNVDFDPERLEVLIRRAAAFRDELRTATGSAGDPAPSDHAATFEPAADLNALILQGATLGLPVDRTRPKDIQGLQELTLYGLRGVAAYADHAAILGQEDPGVYAFVQETLTKTLDASLDFEDWVTLALETGKTNLRAMELLDAGNTATYGHPVPTQVPLGRAGGPGRTHLRPRPEGPGAPPRADRGQRRRRIQPRRNAAHPRLSRLKKYAHFYGHYGTAWQNQQTRSSPSFPGAILLTTNCLKRPKSEYMDRMFTTGLVAWPGVPHVHRLTISVP